MTRVILESPYSGDVERNTKYALRCLLDCILSRFESPIASHLLYTQVLDDTVESDRVIGMTTGFDWYPVAQKCVVYTDYGISRGMRAGIEQAELCNVPVEYREIGEN